MGTGDVLFVSACVVGGITLCIVTGGCIVCGAGGTCDLIGAVERNVFGCAGTL